MRSQTTMTASSLLIAWMSLPIAATDITTIFRRPVVSRTYESGQYNLANAERSTGGQVNITTAASAIAGLKPSYVSGLFYLDYDTNLTETMISDFNIVRASVLAASPSAKFDIELNLDPHPPSGRKTYPNAASVISYMEQLDSKLKVDGWCFDYFSTAQKEVPEWVTAVTNYAHDRNQTVGGNVFGNVVPPSADAVAFVDGPSNSMFGFSFDPKEVANLKHNSSSTVILGHLQNNPQNGNSTESCVFMYDWNSTRRAEYLAYWASQQEPQGFTYTFPVFFPLCPGAYSFDPLSDELSISVPGATTPGANNTLYDYILALKLGNISTATSTSSTLA